ncbi:ArsR/SmtB family transcription factor [Rothia sp. P7181]|uniref:ArsR/SmtB family transcription factor n=1 Tax=unclassified Rothia (in: high G+C Gram-positive bacteria) TaxID=2689056 RepID=UPI003ACE80D4
MDSERTWETEYSGSVALFAALAHPLRLALTHHLSKGSHTVSELFTCMGVSQPLVSHHLKILKEAGVITSTQTGRSIIYEVADHHVTHIINDVYEHTKENNS